MDNVNCAVQQTCPVQSLHLCGQVEHRLYQFTSTVVRAYFARQMTWNNPERIAEREGTSSVTSQPFDVVFS